MAERLNKINDYLERLSAEELLNLYAECGNEIDFCITEQQKKTFPELNRKELI